MMEPANPSSQNARADIVLSVIVATYNSAGTIARGLDSLRAQQGANFEILICDGGSQDQTLEIISQYDDIVAHRVSGPDRGVYDAWNKVIPAARGEWIMFLGSDDWLEQSTTLQDLAKRLAAIPRANRQLAFAFGYTNLREGARIIDHFGAEPVTGDRLGSEDYIPFSHTGLLHHRSLFAILGLFDANFRSAGDYEFMLRAMQHPEVRFHHLPMPVAEMAAGGMSTGPQSRLRHYCEMIAARRKLGFGTEPGWLKAQYRRAFVSAKLMTFLGPRATLLATNIYRRLTGKTLRKKFR